MRHSYFVACILIIMCLPVRAQVLALKCSLGSDMNFAGVADYQLELNFDRNTALWKQYNDKDDISGRVITYPEKYELLFEAKVPSLPDRSWKWSIDRQSGATLMWFNTTALPEDRPPSAFKCGKASYVDCRGQCWRNELQCGDLADTIRDPGGRISRNDECFATGRACDKKCEVDHKDF